LDLDIAAGKLRCAQTLLAEQMAERTAIECNMIFAIAVVSFVAFSFFGICGVFRGEGRRKI
jgi:hypothetical protein